MNLQTRSKNLPKARSTECRKLRIEFNQEIDCFSICHFDGSGVLLSEARLSGDEALDYAKTIYAVYDEANNI